MPHNIIYNILTYASIVVWVFPAIKQYKTKYFFLFFIFAATDIFVISAVFLFNARPSLLYFLFFSVLVISFLNTNKVKKHTVAFFFIIILLITTATYLNIRSFDGVILLLPLTGILYFLTNDFLLHIISYNKINIPLLILVLYQVLGILKLLNILLGLYESEFYFYTASAFQILIGLFFSFFSVEDNRLNINVHIKNK
ncbi:MAG: hypothetical protein A2068_02140 [Ignavibacteria bacterium GWB2_35_6b]|nr:MAG: hypothetical protein A2068_02140 [Ignavibacteria bacterium GWB2_35_6b]